MQYLESSPFGLRAVFYRLKSSDHNLEFLVFPVTHIADPYFYNEITSRLSQCDNLIFEGVKSRAGWFLVQSYKVMARKKSLGLVTQNSGMDLSKISIRRIHGDVSAEEFDAAWREIPLLFRVSILLLSPLYGAYKYFTATRESIAAGRSFDDLKNQYDISESDEEEALYNAILHERDKKLLKTIESHIQEDRKNPQVTAIVYGARHLPPIMAILFSRFGYRVAKAEWVNVI